MHVHYIMYKIKFSMTTFTGECMRYIHCLSSTGLYYVRWMQYVSPQTNPYRGDVYVTHISYPYRYFMCTYVYIHRTCEQCSLRSTRIIVCDFGHDLYFRQMVESKYRSSFRVIDFFHIRSIYHWKYVPCPMLSNIWYVYGLRSTLSNMRSGNTS